jgi:hypothetical protein
VTMNDAVSCDTKFVFPNLQSKCWDIVFSGLIPVSQQFFITVLQPFAALCPRSHLGTPIHECLGGLVVRNSTYKTGGPGFYSQGYQTF